MTVAFCSTCERVLYIGAEDVQFCPVCASPLSSRLQPYAPDAAAERIAKNEVIFREANERIRQAAQGAVDDEIMFVCECGHATCNAPVPMRISEYEKVRSKATWFVTLRGHDLEGIEIVVDIEDGYQIVEKLGPPRQIAETFDPRR